VGICEVKCAASGAPVIGFLNGQSPQALAPQVAAFRQALNEAGSWMVKTSRSNIH
jgi:hypothetical protein